jgi:hypothetical protein
MVTLVYKMTHRGDPDADLGCWGVSDCMGQVRGYGFDSVIGIGGRSWWADQTNRAGELIWIGLDPQEIPGGKRGPKLTFAHFRYFPEGEKVLSEIAPKLARAMRNRRFMLYGFSQGQEQEIKTILKLAMRAEPSALLFTKATDLSVHEHARCPKVCRQERT